MRLLLALAYISSGMWLFFKFGGADLNGYITGAVFAALLWSSETVCNEGFFRKLRGISYEQHIAELLQNNKAVIEKYAVLNSIVFEDLGTGCTAYLLDVGGHKMICLYGQDYGFEPIDDDPEWNQERKFPTETFSLIREIKKDRILEVTPKEKVLEPIIIENPNIKKLYDFGFKLDDGEVVESVSFTEVLNALKL